MSTPGVRARMIGKDGRPRRNPATLDAVTADGVERSFTAGDDDPACAAALAAERTDA